MLSAGNSIWEPCTCALDNTPLAVVGLAIVVCGIIAIVMATSSTCGGLLPLEEPVEEEPKGSLYEGLVDDLAPDDPAQSTAADGRSSHSNMRASKSSHGMRKSASFSAVSWTFEVKEITSSRATSKLSFALMISFLLS